MSTGHLDQLLLGIADAQVAAVPGIGRIVLSGLTLDSRRVRRGDAFFALRGSRGHGIEFAASAVQRGAQVVLAEAPAVEAAPLDVPLLWIENLHDQVGEIAARFHDRPAEAMRVVGVTGTNGKTSCVQLLAQALTLLGHRAASIGTLGAGLHGQLREGERTTPDAVTVQQLLAEFRDAGASHVAMEVSSHALAQGRVAAVDFEVAAFTNLTRDHLDYHGSMEAYGAAKAKLFAWPGLQAAVINIDDAFGHELATQLAPGVRLLRFSMADEAEVEIVASGIVTSAEGLAFRLRTPWGAHAFNSHLLGRFNVANLLAVIGCLGALGESFERIVKVVEQLQPVNGRMNRLGGLRGLPLVVVDYAHTPDALEQALTALRAHCAGKLICVFGCGGERDAGKRPLMGAIAARLADVAIVTDDNPRGEEGDVIVAQIVAGMSAAPAMTVERDRAVAIADALALARTGDVVLIAGKGHETYQDGAAGKRPFDDLAVAHAALERLSRGAARMMRLGAIAMWTHGRLLGGNAELDQAEITGVAIDTRKLQPGNLFVALKGGHVDGHDYLDEAAAGGAVAAMVTRQVDSALPQLLVDDGEAALGDLASAARAQRDVRVVGITGSNGKTTVKTLVASILSRHGRTHVSAGNYNNELGLPLSLLAMPQDAEYAVLEMGAGKPGDIAYLAAIARPDIGLVTLIAPAHLERMGSIEGVAETKGALYQALPAAGIAIINADDPFASFFEGLAGARKVLHFGLDHPAEVRADIMEQGIGGSRFLLGTPHGDVEVRLPLPGRHNIANALAAAAVALALEVPLETIVAGLQQVPGVAGRLRRHVAVGGWTVIDDSYNANPSSMTAAIDTLLLAEGERWLVLGDMAELGADARVLHAGIGEYARQRGVDRLFAVGALGAATVEAFGAGGEHFDDKPALIAALRAQLHPGVSCLVKGSRSAGMEQVAAALVAARTGTGGASDAA